MGISKKLEVLNRISNVDKTVDILSDDRERINLVGIFDNGNKISISFIEGGTLADAEVKHTDIRGYWRNLTVSCIPGSSKYSLDNKTIWRYRVQKGAQIYLNEWIWQLNNIYNGGTPIDGEYNHFLPRATGYEERLGINEGEICSKERNDAHKSLFLTIKKETGLWVKVKSSGKGYELLNKKHITPEDVIELGIQKDGYIDLT